MARPRAHSLLVLALLLTYRVVTAPSLARAGAWVQPPGGRYVKASLLGLRADSRWDCRGNLEPADPSGAFVDRQILLYGEFGWTDRVTLVGSWAYKDQQVEAEPAFGTRSTGDLRVGTRVGLVRAGARVLSLEGMLSIPTYPASDLSRPPAERAQYLPAGSGRVEAELRLQAGLSLHPWPLYANLDAGYRARGGSFQDQWLATAELGGGGGPTFAKLELRWVAPRSESCDDLAVGAIAPSERKVQLAPEAALRVGGPFWISLGYALPLAGRNSLDAGQWSVGLVHWVTP